MSTHPGVIGPTGATGLGWQNLQRDLEFEAGQRQGATGASATGSTDATVLAGATGVNGGQMASTAAMASMAQSPSEFMEQVVAWPGPDGPGYVNLHWKTPHLGHDGKPIWGGKPFKVIKPFMDMAQWGAS